MDIIYSLDTKKILMIYDTSGEVNATGSVPYQSIIDDCKKNNFDLGNIKVWSWISFEERKNLPQNFYSNYENYSILESNELNIPIGISDGEKSYILREIKPIKNKEDIPIIWSGMLFNSISYSLINRKIILGLKDRGFDIYACGMISKDYSEIPADEKKRLEKLGCYGMHLDKKNAIRVYCYLPITRNPPSLYNVSYTMMESSSINNNLVNSLNIYNNECWFPCFTEDTYISTNNRYITPIANTTYNQKLLTHTNTYKDIKIKSNKKYNGYLYSIDTFLKNKHFSCTEKHPFLTIDKMGNIKEKIAKELTIDDNLFYIRQNKDNKKNTLNLEEFLTYELDNSKIDFKFKKDKLYLSKEKFFYNHFLNKEDSYFPMQDGFGSVDKNIPFNDIIPHILTMYLENSDLKFANKKEAQSFIEKLNAVFSKDCEFLIEEKYNFYYIVLSSCFRIVLDSLIRFVIDDEELLKDNEKDIFSEFSLSQKKQIVKTLIDIYNKKDDDIVRFRLFGKKKILYYVGIMLDIGIVPTIDYEKNKNDLNSKYVASITINKNQNYRLRDILNNKEIQDYEDDFFIIKNDKIIFKIKNISRELVKNVNVYNFEVNEDNTYVANFIVTHNCNFNIEEFKKEGLKTETKFMPLACDDKMYNDSVEPLDLSKIKLEIINPNKEDYPKIPNNFIFLSIFRYSYRKGPDVLIKSFKEAFNKNDNVSLVVFSRHYLGNIEKDNINTIDAVRADLKKWLGDSYDSAPIYWCYDFLKDEDMPKLFNAANCFVSTSRGEGQNLPALEAGACKVPIIAPENTAFSDYMNNDRGYVIETDGYENCGHVEWDNGEAKYIGDNPEWMVWITSGFEDQLFPILGEKAIKQTAAHMKEVFFNYKDAKVKAEKMYNYIKENYTWDVCIDRIAKRLKKIQEKIYNENKI